MTRKRHRIFDLGVALLMAAGAMVAGEKAGKAEPRPAPPPLTLPRTAVQQDAGTYTYTDEAGKKWIYRRTPFGLKRFEARDTTEADREYLKKDAASMQAFEDGEYVRFERPSPFGTYRWKQKKTELTAVEQMAWDRARAQKSGARDKE